YFFFSGRRRHTRFSRDWSSDVCSSDLDLAATQPAQLLLREIRHVAALVEDAPTGDAPVPPEIAHDPHGDGGLAAAGLADQPHGLPLHDREVEVENRRYLSRTGEVADAEALALEERLLGGPVREDVRGVRHGLSSSIAQGNLAQSVREQVEAEDQRGDGDGRNNRHPGR